MCFLYKKRLERLTEYENTVDKCHKASMFASD